MFCSRFFCTLLFISLFAVCSHASDWRFNAGLGIRNQTPVVAIAGLGYKELIFRAQGMGYIRNQNDYWSGFRGSLLWTFFKDSPFNLDAGLGGGYEYARAPNEMHEALDKANGLIVFPYNYKELGDISIELWTRLYGFYTQISVPTKKFAEHDAHKVFWGAGYMVEF